MRLIKLLITNKISFKVECHQWGLLVRWKLTTDIIEVHNSGDIYYKFATPEGRVYNVLTGEAACRFIEVAVAKAAILES